MSKGLISADTVLLCLREVMGSDRAVINERLALGHTAAFNESRCAFSPEKSLAYLSVYAKADSLTDINSNVNKFMLLI